MRINPGLMPHIVQRYCHDEQVLRHLLDGDLLVREGDEPYRHPLRLAIQTALDEREQKQEQKKAILPGKVLHGRQPYMYPGLYIGTGNRCGHRPQRPVNERIANPLVDFDDLPQAIQRIRNVFLSSGTHGHEYQGAVSPVYDSPRLYPLFTNSGKANLDGTPRCDRSELRLIEVRVLATMVEMANFASTGDDIHIGTPRDDGSFSHRSMLEIALSASTPDGDCLVEPENPHLPLGLWTFRPTQRYRRATKALKNKGHLTVVQRYEERDGHKYALTAVKSISAASLISLGVVSERQLREFRDNRRRELAKRRNIWRATRPDFVAKRQAEREARAKVRGQLRPSNLAGRCRPGYTPLEKTPEQQLAASLWQRYRGYQHLLMSSLCREQEQHGHPPYWVRERVRQQLQPFETWKEQQPEHEHAEAAH
ncbi:hypothetical protein QCD60_29345 [Pokkaliibacter sp. MBI-7]|uniref:hypothetical protein n=1 Tax=Pokkaliibacter sp. MBI-7 TaxID=3040600 RepID=UPI00244C5F23|nr:hypothetical protein [Pokkaliibacter sp. MBI-7]MDH2436622.1 hypothetical protein [Pokkaliibacter sp. MBI-7]